MLTKIKIFCTLTLLAIAGQALAQAAPSPVTGIVANMLNNEVVVQWNPVTSDPIDYYRVYYSADSILDNDGLFDDFEVTKGDMTTLSFIPPGQGMLYVSVIAVAMSGLESEYFTEEASIDLGAKEMLPTGVFSDTEVDTTPTPSVDESVPTYIPEAPADATSVRLLKATVTSPSEIMVEFSATLTVDPKRAPEGLKIEAPDGKKLQIKSIIITGKTIVIATEVQTKGAVYNISFSEPFVGNSGLPLDVEDRSVLVTGHANGVEAVITPPPPPIRTVNPQEPPELSNVTIASVLQPNGLHTVTLEWNPLDNTPGDLYGIAAYQTRDGQNFGPPDLLPIEIRGVVLNDVTPGFYGIYLQTVNMYGFTSRGVFRYVSLPTNIPGYGFNGDLILSAAEGAQDSVKALAEQDTTPKEGVVQLAVITSDTPMQTLEGIDHSAAYKNGVRINWMRAIVLATSVVVTVALMITGFLFITKRKGSATA